MAIFRLSYLAFTINMNEHYIMTYKLRRIMCEKSSCVIGLMSLIQSLDSMSIEQVESKRV